MKNIVIITNIPTPYRIPLFNQIHEDFKSRDMKLVVIFAALGYERRKWRISESNMKFEYLVLKSSKIKPAKSESPIFSYSGLYKQLKLIGPDAIIATGFSIATVKIWLLRVIGKYKYVIWSGTILNENRPVSLLRRIQRRLLVKAASSYISYGSMAKEYLISMGANPEKVSIAINTVDVDFYLNSEKSLKKRNSEKPSKLIYVGNLTKGKCIDKIISCLMDIKSACPDISLVLVGDGPERENLEFLANEIGVSDLVSFKGFRDKEDVLRYLTEADCFIFPSEYDVWGLVLIEALAAGLPCIASIKSGATVDLIQDGFNGFAVDFNNKGDLVKKILEVISNKVVIEQMSKNSKNFVTSNLTLNKSSEGFVKAISDLND